MQIETPVPYPPSVNHYWYQRGPRKFIGRKGKEFRQKIKDQFRGYEMIKTKIRAVFAVSFPDRRKRDLDNLLKPMLDALQDCGLIEDDKNIIHLTIYNTGTIVKGGHIVMSLKDEQ